MEKLMVLLAHSMDEEMVLKELSEALKEYELIKTKETKSSVQMYVTMAFLKFGTEGKSADELFKQMEKVDEIKKVADRMSQNS